jgi:hypothetical protein
MHQLIGMSAVVAVIIFATCYPFLPGRYDPLAVPLSAMAQVFGSAGLLLVPLGFWSALAGRRRAGVPAGRGSRTAAVVGLVVVWLLVALTATIASGFALGLVTLLAGIVAGSAATRRAGAAAASGGDPALAGYLLVLPPLVFVLQWVLVDRLVDFSRGRAIRNSAPLVADIERYRAERGHYPISLLSLWSDYDPAIVGIERYRYERSGDAYNLLFEQFTADLAARELVVYNPRGEQEATSHDMDLLRAAPARLGRMRGYFAVRETPFPGWKRFLFD